MSRFFSVKYNNLVPYVPGEQPRERKYIKLNTNESPFPPSEKARLYASEAAKMLCLYPDPECTELTKKMAENLGVNQNQIIFGNGSDEILNFAFMAFCDIKTPAVFPDITYGFYPVFAEINCIPYIKIPLKPDFSINTKDYMGINKTIFIANPNAPTGIALKPGEIEKIVQSNPDNVVVIDEAYVDFGAETCIPLIKKYENLLVVQTFSKSRSMAGARLGFGIGSPAIIQDLNTVKYSINPYNINSMTMAAGMGAIEDDDYTRKNCKTIIENRLYTQKALIDLGFEMTNSSANFIFAKHKETDGKTLYLKLKERGILVRHFDHPVIKDYNRITIGTQKEMEKLIQTIRNILEES